MSLRTIQVHYDVLQQYDEVIRAITTNMYGIEYKNIKHKAIVFAEDTQGNIHTLLLLYPETVETMLLRFNDLSIRHFVIHSIIDIYFYKVLMRILTPERLQVFAYLRSEEMINVISKAVEPLYRRFIYLKDFSLIEDESYRSLFERYVHFIDYRFNTIFNFFRLGITARENIVYYVYFWELAFHINNIYRNFAINKKELKEILVKMNKIAEGMFKIIVQEDINKDSFLFVRLIIRTSRTTLELLYERMFRFLAKFLYDIGYRYLLNMLFCYAFNDYEVLQVQKFFNYEYTNELFNILRQI